MSNVDVGEQGSDEITDAASVIPMPTGTGPAGIVGLTDATVFGLAETPGSCDWQIGEGASFPLLTLLLTDGTGMPIDLVTGTPTVSLQIRPIANAPGVDVGSLTGVNMTTGGLVSFQMDTTEPTYFVARVIVTWPGAPPSVAIFPTTGDGTILLWVIPSL